MFEDSVTGVEAGRRAGMRVVWCPHPEVLKEYKGREKEVLAGIAHLTKEELAESVFEFNTGGKVEGKPGRIDDGWAEMVDSLEGFPCHSFGIEI